PGAGSGTPGVQAPGLPACRLRDSRRAGSGTPARARVRREGDGTLTPLMSAPEPPDAPVVAPGGDEPSSPGDDTPDDTSDDTSDIPEEPDGEGGEEQLAQYPPVVAVVVTRNPGPWLEGTLAG